MTESADAAEKSCQADLAGGEETIADRPLVQLRTVLAERLGPERVRVAEPLARHTSYRIGGPADLFVSVESAEELAAAVTLARENGVPCFVLGAGSNVLVSDRGVRGLVVQNRARAVTWTERGDRALVTSESGASLGRLARQAACQGWAGLAWACGIPGTVGGGVVQNAGAHGSCMADVLQSVTILDDGNVTRRMAAGKLGLVYRSSVFRQKTGRKWVILSAVMGLRRGDPAQLASRIADHDAWRQAHQPTGASCGSVFKNPPGDYAGRLIEAAGLKGECAGGAEIASLHANFFVNTGDATADDVMALIDRVRHEVMLRFGVALELEVELAGEWGQGMEKG
jgi:UDP-N-acetylmuramate dehydrogenase